MKSICKCECKETIKLCDYINKQKIRLYDKLTIEWKKPLPQVFDIIFFINYIGL